MMYNGLMLRWNAFGVALMLSVALLNTSCSSTRQVLESTTQQTQIEQTTTQKEQTQTRQEHEQTHDESGESVTVTEVEIYDTNADADPVTGEHPVKARIKQRTDRNGTIRKVAATHTETNAETDLTQVYNGGEISEVVVVAERPPSLWERIKKGMARGVLVLISVAVGWLIYKLKKR